MSVAITQQKQFIGGEFVDSASGETMEVLNPSTGDVIAEVPRGTEADVERAISAAQSAWSEWQTKTPKDRMELLLALADVIDENADELARLESVNVGKPWWVAKDEPGAMSDCLRFFAGAARNLEGKSAGEYVEGYTSMIRREPLGIVAGICPWNYPLYMAIWKIGPALAAGNVQIIKPAEQTPLTILRFVGARAGGDPGRRAAGRDGRRHPGGRRARAPSGGPARLAHGGHGNGKDHREERRGHRQARCTSSSAARRRWSCSTTPMQRPSPRRSRSAATSTRARTARPRRASSCRRGSTTTCSPRR